MNADQALELYGNENQKRSERLSSKWFKKTVLTGGVWTPPIESKDTIRLDLNENQFVESERLINEIDWSSINSYPAYDRLDESLSLESGMPKECILATNGADQAIEIFIRSLSADFEVVLAVPTFSYYQHVLSIEGLSVKKIYYNDDLSFNLDQVLGSISDKTGAIILTSPSNPLLTEISEYELVAILKKALEFDTVVLVDEVYTKFIESNFSHLIGLYSNLVLIRSFSKYHGLASVRLGYILSCRENIEQYAKIRGPWDISNFSAQMVSSIIESPNWLDYLPAMHANRRMIAKVLTDIGADVKESKINFLLFYHPYAEQLHQYLKRNGVVLARMEDYPDSNGILKNALRMSIPNKRQLEAVIQLLASYK